MDIRQKWYNEHRKLITKVGNMTKQLVNLLGVTAAVLGVTSLFPLSTVAAAGNECPQSWQLRSVESLAETGNEPIPGQIDAAGNNDGFVCAHPLPDAVCLAAGYDPCPVETVYAFKDNRQ
jgi:hypothetical protein